MVEVSYIANAGSIITIIVGAATLGTFVWQMARWVSRRADVKAAEIRAQLEAKAIEDRKERDDIAEMMRIQIDKNASEGRQVAITVAEEIKQAGSNQYTELATKLLLLQQKVDDKIQKVDDKVMDMLSGLTKRSDLVNGNIASIRADIADLQEDINDIGLANESPTNTKERKRAMRLKRRRIEADRVAQSNH